MKRILLISLLFLSFASLNQVGAQEKMKWKEMESFHEVMAATFHPADEGKMGPIKERSHEMLEKAIEWKHSKAPEGYDKKAVKRSLKELAKGSRNLNKLIKRNASDEEIKKKLSSLHDTFHEIMEKSEKNDHH